MLDIPLSVIFSWPAPNYLNPPTKGGGVDALAGTLGLLMVFTVALRYYVRLRVKRWFGFDDAFIGLALLSAIGFDVTVAIAARKYGFRLHVWDIPWTSLESTLKSAYACKILFAFATIFTRASILCFYTRLVHNSGVRWFTRTVHLAQLVNVLTGAVMVCLTIWQCRPPKAYWIFPPRGDVANQCSNEKVTSVISGVLNFLSDLVVTIVPMPLVFKLNMPKSQKIGVSILLGLGFFVSILGIVRTYLMYKTLQGYDITWHSFTLWIVAIIEIFFMIVCACAPALRSLTSHVAQSKLFKSLTSGFSSRKSSTARIPSTSPSTADLHTLSHASKEEAQCRCAELQELEARLCNPTTYKSQVGCGSELYHAGRLGRDES